MGSDIIMFLDTSFPKYTPLFKNVKNFQIKELKHMRDQNLTRFTYLGLCFDFQSLCFQMLSNM